MNVLSFAAPISLALVFSFYHICLTCVLLTEFTVSNTVKLYCLFFQIVYCLPFLVWSLFLFDAYPPRFSGTLDPTLTLTAQQLRTLTAKVGSYQRPGPRNRTVGYRGFRVEGFPVLRGCRLELGTGK